MNISELEHLKEDERNLVLTAPALITILIGGADDEFDAREEARARKAVHYRSMQGDTLLFDYYKAVDVSFASTIKLMSSKYSVGAAERAISISEELSVLNDILPKLETRFAKALLSNWRNLAKEIARSSGGILGYATISDKEAEFINLDMISYQP